MNFLNICTLLINDKVLKIYNDNFCAFLCNADSFDHDLTGISDDMDDFSIVAEEEYQDILAEYVNMEKKIIFVERLLDDKRKNDKIIRLLWSLFKFEALFIREEAPVRKRKGFHDFASTGLLWQLKPI